MIYILTVLVVLGILSFYSARGISAEKKENRGKEITYSQLVKSGYAKEEIKGKLLELSKSPAPKQLSPGAMCYAPATQLERADYVCPKCGGKTIYAQGMVYIVEGEIPRLRALAKDIKGLDIKLDESQFCKICHPEVKEPELCIIVSYKDADKPYKVCKINSIDLILISGFLNNNDKYNGSTGQEYPIKDKIDRLQELLGVSIK